MSFLPFQITKNTVKKHMVRSMREIKDRLIWTWEFLYASFCLLHCIPITRDDIFSSNSDNTTKNPKNYLPSHWKGFTIWKPENTHNQFWKRQKYLSTLLLSRLDMY